MFTSRYLFRNKLIQFLTMITLSTVSFLCGHAGAQSISFSDLLTGNIDLPDNTYSKLEVDGYGIDGHFALLDRLVFTNATISDGRLTHAEGSEPFRSYGLDFSFLGGAIDIHDGKLYLTSTLRLPQIFAMASDSDPTKPGASVYQPIEEQLTVYFDGENVGFSEIDLQLPDLILEGVGSLTGVTFQLATDPAFYLHVGGGIHLAQLSGVPGLDDDSSPGIDTELEVGKLQDRGMAYSGLKKFRIAASGLDQNIDGMDIVFLQSIDISIGDIMIDLEELERLASFYLEGSLTLTVLPAVDGIAIVEVTAGGKVKPWPIYISIFSSSKFFGFFELSDSQITYQFPNMFLYSVCNYLIPGVIKIEGTLSGGSWRTQFVTSLCPMTPASAYDDLDHFDDECVQNALNNWQDTNIGLCDTPEEARVWDTLFHGGISAHIQIPDAIPIVGGNELAGIDGRVTQDFIYARADFLLWYASALIRFGTSGVEFEGGWKQLAQPLNSWEIPYNQPYILEEPTGSLTPYAHWRQQKSSKPMSVEEKKPIAILSFMDNWNRVDASTTGNGMKPFQVSPAGETVTTLHVPEGAPAVIFRLNYENEDGAALAMTLTLPDRTILNFTDGFLPDGFSEVIGYSTLKPAAREGYFTIDSPAAGDYIITVSNEEQLGNFTVEALVMGNPAEIELLSVEFTGQANECTVTWDCHDPDDNASVFVYLDPDRTEGAGYIIGAYPEEGEINSHTFDTTALSVPAGYYYVAAGISDGQFGMVWDYSEERIFISDPDAPAAVTGIAVACGDRHFTVEWEPSTDPTVAGYAVRWTEQDDLGHFEGEYSVYGRENHQLTITDMTNGVPYLVTVLAISEETKFSHPETVLRVVPHAADGSTPPVLISAPYPYARIGVEYVYMPKFSDCERHFQNGIEMKWTLLNGPEGMTVQESNGFMQWTPTSEQEGVHTVKLERSIYVQGTLTETIDESFTIKARYAYELPASENSTNHILSSPSLSAVEDTTYQHQIEVYDPNGAPAFALLEGPDGLTCSETGLLRWAVPQDTKGGPIRVLVIYSDGEEEAYDFYLDVISPSNTLKGSSVRNFQELK